MEICYIRLPGRLPDDAAGVGVDEDNDDVDGPTQGAEVVERHRPVRVRGNALLHEAHLVLVPLVPDCFTRDLDGFITRYIASC